MLGHSWGSIVGLTLAQQRPEWLHAYIGMGQGIVGRESERRGWRFAMERALSDGNQEAIRELRSIAPYAAEGEPMTLEALYLQRVLVSLVLHARPFAERAGDGAQR